MMKRTGLCAFAVSLMAGWTTPSFAAEARDEHASAEATPGVELAETHDELAYDKCGMAEANACRCCIRQGEDAPDGETTLERYLHPQDAPCCEDVADAQECFNWGCVAGVTGGSLRVSSPGLRRGPGSDR